MHVHHFAAAPLAALCLFSPSAARADCAHPASCLCLDAQVVLLGTIEAGSQLRVEEVMPRDDSDADLLPKIGDVVPVEPWWFGPAVALTEGAPALAQSELLREEGTVYRGFAITDGTVSCDGVPLAVETAEQVLLLPFLECAEALEARGVTSHIDCDDTYDGSCALQGPGSPAASPWWLLTAGLLPLAVRRRRASS